MVSLHRYDRVEVNVKCDSDTDGTAHATTTIFMNEKCFFRIKIIGNEYESVQHHTLKLYMKCQPKLNTAVVVVIVNQSQKPRAPHSQLRESFFVIHGKMIRYACGNESFSTC